MRAFRIDLDGVAEIDADEKDILVDEVSWDYASLDPDHDVWVHDEGLVRPGLAFARIGSAGRLPLPAYILGIEGETTVGASLALEDVRRMVRIIDRSIASCPTTKALMGIDSKLGGPRPGYHEWRVVVALPGDDRNVHSFYMRLPDASFISGVHEDGHGDLRELAFTPEQQYPVIAAHLRRAGVTTISIPVWSDHLPVVAALEEEGFTFEAVEMPIPQNGYKDSFGIGGEGGFQIELLLKPGLAEWIKSKEDEEIDRKGLGAMNDIDYAWPRRAGWEKGPPRSRGVLASMN